MKLKRFFIALLAGTVLTGSPVAGSWAGIIYSETALSLASVLLLIILGAILGIIIRTLMPFFLAAGAYICLSAAISGKTSFFPRKDITWLGLGLAVCCIASIWARLGRRR